MPLPAPVLSPEIPITPSAEDWAALSPRAQEQHLERVIAALQAQAEAMSEGRPHFRAKVSAATTLGDHFDRVGKQIYLACGLPVLYPPEPAFSPDLMAVLDVPDPGDADTRMGWVVEREGRGLDLALEIHYSGDKEKDLVTNVARYARLGIPEYFVYDRFAQRLYGYRLGSGRQYQSIPARGGALTSRVLGLNLRVVDGRLRFYSGEAESPETRELLARLEGLMDERERRIAEEIAARIEAEAQRDALKRERDALKGERDTILGERDAIQAQRDAALARAAALEAELAALRARTGT